VEELESLSFLWQAANSNRPMTAILVIAFVCMGKSLRIIITRFFNIWLGLRGCFNKLLNFQVCFVKANNEPIGPRGPVLWREK
jgi:hypothetical protein